MPAHRGECLAEAILDGQHRYLKVDRRNRMFVLGKRWITVTEWWEGKQGSAPWQVVVEEEERAGRIDQEEESSMWPLANQGT
jgi:hypothetical protein